MYGCSCANTTGSSQVSYVATESKRTYLSALEMRLWGGFVPVLLLVILGHVSTTITVSKVIVFKKKDPLVYFSKGFLLTTCFLPPAHDSTGSMRLLVLDR